MNIVHWTLFIEHCEFRHSCNLILDQWGIQGRIRQWEARSRRSAVRPLCPASALRQQAVCQPTPSFIQRINLESFPATSAVGQWGQLDQLFGCWVELAVKSWSGRWLSLSSLAVILWIQVIFCFFRLYFYPVINRFCFLSKQWICLKSWR